MADEKWQKVRKVFDSALRRTPDQRRKFISEACGDDKTVLAEVESLLSSLDSAEGFMETPAVAKVAGVIEAQMKHLESGQNLGHYEIISLIGEGGMGEVYLAQDTRLERKAAIKILPGKLAQDEDRMQRFVREAKSASALNHPNIITIYEIGEKDNTHFIATEYIEGDTLRERLEGSPVNLKSVLEIAIQAASALDAAHRTGIVHRDIKPENVMIRPDGLVKILDFGIAKLTEKRSETDLEAATAIKAQTSPGMIIGTAAYMSPEQARGQTVDARSDIFSFGVLLYEMLAGKPPFEGENAIETIGSILNKEPVPLSRQTPEVPHEIERIINKTLRKDREERYQTAKDLLIDLKDVKQDLEFQNKLERTAEPDRKEAETQVFNATTSDVPSHQSSSAEYIVSELKQHKRGFAIGLAILLLAAVGSGVWLVKNRLQAAETLPSASIDSEASSKQITLNDSGRSPAYDLYVRGKVKVASENREDTEAAIKLLEEAVAIDPNFAEAFAQLARGYNTMAFKYSADADRKRLYENAEVAIDKALALNPNLAEAHFARGLILWTNTKRFPHEQAIQSYKRSLVLDPTLDETHHQLSLVYSHIGLLDQADQSVKKTLEINPNNTLARFRAGVYVAYQGKFDEAIAIYKTIPRDFTPLLVDRSMAEALIQTGHLGEAEAIVDDYLRRFPQDEGGSFTGLKALLQAKAGEQTEAEEAVGRAVQIGSGFGHFHHTAYNIASTYAALNKPDEAVKWLETAAENGFPNYTYFEVDPNLNNIRKYQQFIDFMAKEKLRWERFKTL